MDDQMVSRHADFRLLQRTQSLDQSVTDVWNDAIECEVAYHGYDEARVSPEHDIVLLKEDDMIVTCLNNTHNVTIDGDSLESYLDAAITEERDQ